MNRLTTISVVFGLAVVVCAEARAQRGRGGPPSPDRMFEFMDRDRNGELDRDEIERLPGPMRAFVEQSGLARSGGSVRREDFLQRTPQMMEFIRERREEEGDDRRGFGGFSGDGDRSRFSSRNGDDGRDRSSSNSSRGNSAGSRSRVTVDLPDDYRERDLNGDGQIALYEWRIWKRTALAEFAELDRNRDGFLVPRELVKSEPNASPSTARSSQRLVIVGRSQNSSSRSDSRSSSDDRGRGSSSDSDDDPDVRRAETYFGYLDRNRDGRLTEEEWSASRRLRPMFEDAGVDLSREMSRDQFIQSYVRIARDD